MGETLPMTDRIHTDEYQEKIKDRIERARSVDEDMLIRAVKEAVKVGILPKHGVSEETYLKHWSGMKKVLEAALND